MNRVWGTTKASGRFLVRHGRVFWLLGGLLLGMAINIMPMIMMMMAGFGGGGGGFGNFPTSVEVAMAEKTTLDDSASVAGSLQAEEGVVMKSEVAAMVEALPLEQGEMVKKGTILVVLDDKTTSANLAQARAQANVARRAFDRVKQLQGIDKALVSQKDYDAALSNMEVAAAGVKVAEAAYAKTHIAAPFDGTVGLRQVSVGEYVQVGQPLVSLQSLGDLKVDFSLPERYATGMSPGQDVMLSVDALGGEKVSASIVAVDPLVSEDTRNVAVRARLDDENGKLRPGMFVRVAATLDHVQDAITVPEEAIVPEGDSKFVYKIVNSQAVKTPVELGMRSHGDVQVTKGLRAGEVVVIGGQMKLHDGGKVVATNMTLTSSTTPVSDTVPDTATISDTRAPGVEVAAPSSTEVPTGEVSSTEDQE
ncbi:MAG: efflux RND transporter periplasmic adaptor subunit [Proteobacteria bacterium]|nr:efflux RND transporter periplasmic adaptor subunit [Pseudomonadota bacterium]